MRDNTSLKRTRNLWPQRGQREASARVQRRNTHVSADGGGRSLQRASDGPRWTRRELFVRKRFSLKPAVQNSPTSWRRPCSDRNLTRDATFGRSMKNVPFNRKRQFEAPLYVLSFIFEPRECQPTKKKTLTIRHFILSFLNIRWRYENIILLTTSICY